MSPDNYPLSVSDAKRILIDKWGHTSRPGYSMQVTNPIEINLTPSVKTLKAVWLKNESGSYSLDWGLTSSWAKNPSATLTDNGLLNIQDWAKNNPQALP